MHKLSSIEVWDMSFHLTNVHDIVTLSADRRAMSNLESCHATGVKSLVEYTTYEDGIIHPVVLVVFQTFKTGVVPTIQDIRCRAHGRLTFEFRRHEAADVDPGSGIDESEFSFP